MTIAELYLQLKEIGLEDSEVKNYNLIQLSMEKKSRRKLKWGKWLSLLTILLGVVLLVYMVIVEDEPGALPVLLLLIGIVLFVINHHLMKKRQP